MGEGRRADERRGGRRPLLVLQADTPSIERVHGRAHAQSLEAELADRTIHRAVRLSDARIHIVEDERRVQRGGGETEPDLEGARPYDDEGRRGGREGRPRLEKAHQAEVVVGMHVRDPDELDPEQLSLSARRVEVFRIAKSIHHDHADWELPTPAVAATAAATTATVVYRQPLSSTLFMEALDLPLPRLILGPDGGPLALPTWSPIRSATRSPALRSPLRPRGCESAAPTHSLPNC